MSVHIGEFIKEQETAYQLPVTVIDGWEWNMKEHIRVSTLYKNSQFSTGNSYSHSGSDHKGGRDLKPFKNIVLPILRLQYRTEGFDVKDIELFVNNIKIYFKSFLIKKFHEKWARENDIDTFIDEMVESYVDFGGALIKNVNKARPEVVPLQSLAFVDQTDIMSGPIGIKHFFSPDELRKKEDVGWGKESNGADVSLEDLIIMADNKKKVDYNYGVQNETPGKYIEVYEIHGTFPESELKEGGDETKYISQLHIVSMHKDEKDEKVYRTLFKGREKESPFKLLLRDQIYGRALGYGGVEELFEPQIWTNYDAIRKREMLDAASKIIFKTTDASFAARNKIHDMENMEIAVLDEGRDLTQIDTFPRNLAAFDRSTIEWENLAQRMGAATESLLGESPSSGTPFRLNERVVAEGKGVHEYRRGKIAIFVDEIYKDWVIPHIAKEITKGQEFLSELTPEELKEVADSLVTRETNKLVKEKILNAELIFPEEIEQFKNDVREQFVRGGFKKFIKILKGELDKAHIDVQVNIMGKQKDLVNVTDKIVNIFRQIIAAPQILQDPRFMQLFNEILEFSGFSPLKYSFLQTPPPAPGIAPEQGAQPQKAPSTQPLKELIEQPTPVIPK